MAVLDFRVLRNHKKSICIFGSNIWVMFFFVSFGQTAKLISNYQIMCLVSCFKHLGKVEGISWSNFDAII